MREFKEFVWGEVFDGDVVLVSVGGGGHEEVAFVALAPESEGFPGFVFWRLGRWWGRC